MWCRLRISGKALVVAMIAASKSYSEARQALGDGKNLDAEDARRCIKLLLSVYSRWTVAGLARETFQNAR